MSQANAKMFVEMVLNDDELQKRTEAMEPEEVLACAKEQGLEFTLEELKDVDNNRELSTDELDEVVGGEGVSRLGSRSDTSDRCPPTRMAKSMSGWSRASSTRKSCLSLCSVYS